MAIQDALQLLILFERTLERTIQVGDVARYEGIMGASGAAEVPKSCLSVTEMFGVETLEIS